MSRDLRVVVRIDADGRPAIEAFNSVERASRGVGTSFERTSSQAEASFGKTRRGIESISTRLERLSALANGLVGLAVGSQVIASYTRLADSYTNTESKLRLVTEGEAALSRVRAAAFDIAQRTRQSNDSTVELYARLTRATQTLNLTEEQRLRIVETVNKSLVVSGTSAATANAAIVQLSQGLASGVLRGDEFNSVAEQAPILMDLLAASLGRTRGELRAMAEDGQITAEVLTSALLSGASDVDAQFAQMSTTIAGASQQLSNAFQQLVGGASGSLGVTSAIAAGISTVAKNLDTIITVVVAAGVAWGTGYVASLTAAIAADIRKAATTAALARAESQASIQRTAARVSDLARTAEVIAAARAEEIGRLNGAKADIAAAQATLRATEATGAQSAALRLNLIATEQLTAARARQTQVSTALATLGAQQSRLEQQSVQAQVASQAAVAGAVTRTSQALTGLKTAGSAVVGFLGGPWVVGIMAAVGTVLALNSAVDSADEYLEKIAQRQRESADEWQKLTAAITANREAYRSQNPELIQRDLARNNEELERAARAAEAGGPAAGMYAAKVKLLADRQAELTAELAKANPALAEQQQTLTKGQAAIDAVIKSSEERIASLRKQIAEAQDGARGALMADLDELKRQGVANEGIATREQQEALQRNAQLLAELEGRLKALSGANRGATQSTRDSTRAEDDRARVLERLSQLQDAAVASTSPLAQAQASLARAMHEVRAARAGLIATNQLTAESELRLADVAGIADDQYRDALQTIADRRLAAEGLLSEIDEEIRLLGMSSDERERYVETMRFEAELRERIRSAQQAGSDLTEDEIAGLREGLRVRLEALGAARVMRSQQDELAAASRAAAEEHRRTWMNAVDSVAGAFGNWVANGMKSFRDFGRELVNIAKRVVADIVSQFARSQIMRLLGPLLGLGGAPGAAMAGPGGGIGQMIGQIGGGGTGAAGAGGTGLGFLGGAAAPWAFMAGGALLGARGAGSTGGRVAGAVTGGALGLGAFGFASGAAGAIGAGAGLVGAGGALSAGIAGAAAALGPVGLALAAAAVINSLAGGRLFGTSFKPTGVRGTELAFGAGGATGATFQEQSRQRSFFGGTARRTVRGELPDDVRSNIDEAFDSMTDSLSAAARGLGVATVPVIEASWKQITDKTGKVISETTTILGRQYQESLEESFKRQTAEGLIAIVDAALGNTAAAAGAAIGENILEGIGTGVDRGIESADATLAKAGEVIAASASAIAERWRSDASTLLDGAQFLLAAAADIKAGVGLLGGPDSLGALAELVEDLQAPGETLIATYQRVSAATKLLDQALEMSGVRLTQAREDVVRFAVGIADAAGGLDQAAALWNRYFEVAFSADERLSAAIAAAERAASTALTNAGLAAGSSIADIRAAIDRAIAAGAEPEAVVNLLRAADAVGRLNELYGQQTAAIDQTIAALEDERIAREAAAAEARATYAALASDIMRELESVGASEFAREMGEIRRVERERIATLNEAARAAGLQAAREEDLARVHLLAADAAARAIARMRAAAQAIADDLYGTSLSRIEDEIAALQGVGGLGGAIGGIASGASEVGDAWGAVIDRIKASLDDVARGPLGGLRPRDQLAETRRQFDAAIAAARGGDASAAGRANELFSQLLQVGQRVFASGDGYQQLLAESRAALQSLLGMGASGGAAGGGGGGGFAGGVAGGDPTRLQELLAQRDEILAAQESQRRRAQAEELAEYVREIAQVTGEFPLAILAGLGVPLERFAADLGVNLDELTVETANSLAGIANRLAIELPELAAGLGVDLGRLGDANSLINDALEAVIGRQPPEIADALAPLLARVEAAVSPEEQLAALAALEQYIDQLAPAMRLAFAPFFESIDPESVDEQIAILSGARDIAANSLAVMIEMAEIGRRTLEVNELIGVDQLVETRRTTSAIDRAAIEQKSALNAVRDATEWGLQAVVRAIEELQPVEPVPPDASYATGTPRVPRDMVASIHAGEAVIDARSMRVLRDYGIRVQAPAAADAHGKAIVDELRELRAERNRGDAQLREMSARIEQLERAMIANKNAIDRQTTTIQRSFA